MEILKKLNDLDTKLKDIENRDTDTKRIIGLSGSCEQKTETSWSDMYVIFRSILTLYSIDTHFDASTTDSF